MENQAVFLCNIEFIKNRKRKNVTDFFPNNIVFQSSIYSIFLWRFPSKFISSLFFSLFIRVVNLTLIECWMEEIKERSTKDGEKIVYNWTELNPAPGEIRNCHYYMNIISRFCSLPRVHPGWKVLHSTIYVRHECWVCICLRLGFNLIVSYDC